LTSRRLSGAVSRGDPFGNGGRFNRTELPSSAGVQEEWVTRYDNSSVDDATAIAVDNLGNVYVTGASFGSGHEIVTIKYNTAVQ
jgi:hypothetical protein